jgi:hypothetical protein
MRARLDSAQAGQDVLQLPGWRGAVMPFALSFPHSDAKPIHGQ